MNNAIKIPSGWVETSLGEFMEFKNGVNADKSAYGKGVKFVNVMDVFKKSFLEKEDITGSVQITDQQLLKYSVVNGDILFNRTSEIPDEIAFAAVYTGDETVTFGGFVIRGRQTKNFLLPLFAGYCFKNNKIRKEIIRRSQGAVRANIGQRDLNKVSILIPTKEEQEKIVHILSTWDKAIEKIQNLIIAKRRQFEWLQNKLLNDDFRFCHSALLDFANIAKKDKIDSEQGAKLLTVRLHCKGIEANNKNIKITLSARGRSYYVRNTGEFLIGRQSFHMGGFGIVPSDLDGFVASSAITSLDINENELNPEYLFYYFSRKKYYIRIGHIMDGTAQKELSDRQIMRLPVSIPSLDEQNRVANSLNTYKHEITLLEELAGQYRIQKYSLMQKLLTGEWRVKNRKLA